MIEVPRRSFDALFMLLSIRWIRRIGRWVGLRHVLVNFEIELTRLLGLFDRDHYLSQIDPSQLGTSSALRHYVTIGDAQGLSPSPLFDVRHYDAHAGRHPGIVNRLLHYGLVGHFHGVSTSPWFDPEYYLRNNPDVGRTAVDALAHFQRWGWREGRNPLPGLDMRRIFAERPELRQVRGSALAFLSSDWLQHYLRAGQPQRWLSSMGGPEAGSRDAAAAGGVHPLAGASSEPDLLQQTAWADVHPRPWHGQERVDVLIPVYGGTRETLRCLYRVLKAPVRTPHRVLVINDAGPDTDLNAMLRSLSARGLFDLEQHRINQGFVKTINHGLRLCQLRDVVILNSDTEVYNDWLDRLIAHAAEHPRLASVTPLSNNATICSYPQTLVDNRFPLELPGEDLDQLAADANRLRHVKVPTGVGFCMYMRRQALDEVGVLNERAFGRGYGEENDWCQRAIRRGWAHALACDVYVRHVGSVSFKAEAAERMQRAMKTLAKLHPHYERDVARYIELDPSWLYRARLDLARMQHQCGERNVLLVCHSRGGGTERHLVEQSRQLLAQGCGVFELRPSAGMGIMSGMSGTDGANGGLALTHPGLFGLYNLAQLSLRSTGFLREALETLRIHEIHIHHLIDFPVGTATSLMDVARDLGVRIRVAVHDYYLLCPRVNLVNHEGRYCGVAHPQQCHTCLSADGADQVYGSVDAWREVTRQLLEVADTVVVPSQDVARRIGPWCAQRRRKLKVQPHESDAPPQPMTWQAPAEGAPARILVIGAINQIKGLDVLKRLALTDAHSQGALQIGLLGYSSDDPALASAGVELLGRYFDHELAERIEQWGPHIILIPSVWPETYCYVLSSALRSGRRVAVFDLGAQADRVREHDLRHLVLPLHAIDDAAELATHLVDAARAPGLIPASRSVPLTRPTEDPISQLGDLAA